MILAPIALRRSLDAAARRRGPRLRSAFLAGQNCHGTQVSAARPAALALWRHPPPKRT